MDSTMLQGIARFCARFGPWRFRIGWWPEGRQPPLDSSSADGIIALNVSPSMEHWLLDLGRPTVGVDSAGFPLRLPMVNYDEHAIGRIAGEHLLSLGLRHFAYVGTGSPFAMHRLGGFSAIVSERRGGPIWTPDFIAPDHPHAWETFDTPGPLESWLEKLPRPIGVFAMNDHMGARVIAACQTAALRVPTDVAVVGVDNTLWLCETAPVPMSSVKRGSEEAGFQAAALLARLMDESSQTANVSLHPVGVIARRSTEVLDPEHPELMQAVHFIHDHACQRITIADVLEAVPLSRRTLNRLFEKKLGRSPGEQIRQIRLDRARRLLAETELPIDEVARRSGFGWASYLGRAFKAAYRTTPAAFRRNARRHSSKTSSKSLNPR